MGKYMRKTKASGEVAVMELGGALLGVRTRSRTQLLAMQQQQRPPSSPRKGEDPGDFLELRSRRLEKQPHKDKDAFHAGRKEKAEAADELELELELEASFGDNVLDWDAIHR